MDELIKNKLEDLQRKAKEGGSMAQPSSRSTSSLHRIIKTKEQADRFMKMLKSA